MKRTILILASALQLAVLSGCKEQLDVKNPNQPSPASASTESGVISLAQGGVYVSGFKELKYYDGVPGRFWTGAVGFHELMGDIIGEEAANQYGNQIGMPDYVILDDGTRVNNPSAVNTQVALVRFVNVNANAGANPLFFEWAYMYNLNNAMNSVLELAEKASYGGDATIRKNTLKAWAYWWKGYAYSRIGSIYYAGVINNSVGVTNGNYVAKEKIIEEANKNLDQAATLLSGLTNETNYTTVMKQLVPDFNQVGKGVIPAPDMWKRTINTLKARNILVNTTTKAMTAAQWGQILTLTNDGVKSTDNVFTGRSNDNGDFFSRIDGNLAGKTSSPGTPTGTYKISERLIQDFNKGDKRLDNNFTQLSAPAIFNSDRGNSFNTRWRLVDAGKGMAGVVVLSNQAVGAYELYLSSTYEENELMKAEAKIYTGDIAGGLASIDAVRTFQGAGLAPLADLTKEAALEELRKERRVALVFRGLSFYDARRWGVIDDISKGGGRKGAVIVDKAGKVSTNGTINYNFLDYWDVPDNEVAYNPPAANSAPIKNPKQ
jgi:hypothetical protein